MVLEVPYQQMAEISALAQGTQKAHLATEVPTTQEMALCYMEWQYEGAVLPGCTRSRTARASNCTCAETTLPRSMQGLLAPRLLSSYTVLTQAASLLVQAEALHMGTGRRPAVTTLPTCRHHP